MKTKPFFRTLFLFLACMPMLLISCEKDPQPDPEPAPDYREKWAGTYQVVHAQPQRYYVVSVNEETDSMIHIHNGAYIIKDRDVLIHSDGTFAYRSGNSIYDTISGFFTLGEEPNGTDSLYIEYQLPTHFSSQYVRAHCFKMKYYYPEAK